MILDDGEILGWGGRRAIGGYVKEIRVGGMGFLLSSLLRVYEGLPSPITLVTRQSMPSPSRVRDLLLR
jgi:hypothetical protein